MKGLALKNRESQDFSRGESQILSLGVKL